jgi:hypothetical protein
VSGLVSNEIIAIINEEMRLAHYKLEVEESGRVVGALQGNIAGYKLLLSYLSAEFNLSQFVLEDNGEKPLVIPDMSDDEFIIFSHDIEEFKSLEEWRRVLNRIDQRTEDLKNHLLFSAEKTRDLDLSQGTYKGMTVFKQLFNAVEQSEISRQNKKKEDKDAMPLFGAEEGGSIEPDVSGEDYDDDDAIPAVADRVTAFPEAQS